MKMFNQYMGNYNMVWIYGLAYLKSVNCQWEL